MLQNAYIALGTDFPVEEVSPLATFHAAVARKNNQNEPRNGFQMENSLDRISALRGMTMWAAKAQFEEKEKGSIEVGKRADFIILNTDLLQTDEKLLRLSQVISTYVLGEKVYEKER